MIARFFITFQIIAPVGGCSASDLQTHDSQGRFGYTVSGHDGLQSTHFDRDGHVDRIDKFTPDGRLVGQTPDGYVIRIATALGRSTDSLTYGVDTRSIEHSIDIESIIKDARAFCSNRKHGGTDLVNAYLPRFPTKPNVTFGPVTGHLDSDGRKSVPDWRPQEGMLTFTCFDPMTMH